MGRQNKCGGSVCWSKTVSADGLYPGGSQPFNLFPSAPLSLWWFLGLGKRLRIVEVLCATHREPDTIVDKRFGVSLASQAEDQAQAPAMGIALLQVLTDRPQTSSKAIKPLPCAQPGRGMRFPLSSF